MRKTDYRPHIRSTLRDFPRRDCAFYDVMQCVWQVDRWAKTSDHKLDTRSSRSNPVPLPLRLATLLDPDNTEVAGEVMMMHCSVSFGCLCCNLLALECLAAVERHLFSSPSVASTTALLGSANSSCCCYLHCGCSLLSFFVALHSVWKFNVFLEFIFLNFNVFLDFFLNLTYIFNSNYHNQLTHISSPTCREVLQW